MSQTSGTPPQATPLPQTTTGGGTAVDQTLTVTGQLTWPRILALNSGIVILGMGAIFALIGLVYGGLKENIADVKSRVEALDQTLKVAIQSANSVQMLLAVAPKLEDRINTTNEVVARDIPVLRTRVDNIDKKTDELAQTDRDVSQRLGNIQQGIDRLQGQIGNLQERLPRPR